MSCDEVRISFFRRGAQRHRDPLLLRTLRPLQTEPVAARDVGKRLEHPVEGCEVDRQDPEGSMASTA